ncbi:MAG: methyltransferase domain-containing protein [Roseiflexaceae bacterium]
MSDVPVPDELCEADTLNLVSYLLRERTASPLFDLGETLVSPRASVALATHGIVADVFFARHASGDWGAAEAFDRKSNAFAVAHGITRFPIDSLYPLPDGTLLIVRTTPDRMRTGMLLEHELEEHEVTAREGYARWAHQYDREVNPLIAIETPYVEQILAELPIARALDAATGTGRHALRLAQRGVQVAAVDQSPEMLAEARAAAACLGLTIDFRQGTLDAPLPFEAAQFDLVICALALCHVANLRGAIREFARVLRPGGAALITDFHPYCVGQGWRAALFDVDTALIFTYPGHTRDDYLAALADAGLQVTRTVDATMGEAPPGTMLDEEREGGKEIPFCFVALAMKLHDEWT